MCRAIREDAGISQEDIAGTFDPPIARQTVSRWETGDRRPRGERLVQYAELLRSIRSEAL
jgi:DNA-binding transcriptional regulator YiaG